MNGMKSEKGQALILIALGVVALIGFTALAVDGGRVFSDRRNAQNAADTAALQAALAKIRQENYVQKAEQRASSNGYENDTDSTVTVILCSQAPVDDPCNITLPSGASLAEYIRVTITSDVPMTFARVLGRTVVTNKVEAITRVQGSTSSGASWGNAGIVSTSFEPNKICFRINGNSDLHLHGSGISINCTADNAMWLGANINVSFDDDVVLAGCADDQQKQAVFNNEGDGFKCKTPQPKLEKEAFENIPTTDPLPANCDTQPLRTTYTHINTSGRKVFLPGKYPNNISEAGKIEFSNGVYCFLGGFNANTDSITGTGNVQIILGGNFNFANNSNNDFDTLEFYTKDSGVSTKGSIHADVLRFFSTGNGTFDANNAALVSSEDAYFYTESGEIIFNSTTKLDLTAPTEGDYAGLVFHYSWDNQKQFKLNGSTDSFVKGVILMPHSEVTLNGGSGMEVHGQIIAYTFIVNGGNKADVYYEPLYNIGAPASPTIELTK